MSNLASLATRYARRPLLLERRAATEILRHIAASDPRGMRTEGRFEAVLRRIGLNRSAPMAIGPDDADDEDANAVRRPAAYAPIWAQQAYGDPEDEGFAWSLYQGAALMQIAGPIAAHGEFFCGEWYHGYDTILAGLQDAAADTRVGGIFLKVRSPGGVVDGGLYDLSAWIRANRAAAGGKPIHVYVEMAASAGYWVIAPADRVSASRVGLVGSIGAVIVHEDWSGAYQQTGVAMTAIQFGDGKTDFADWKALSPQALADVQAEIDQCGQDFVADVALSRPVLTADALIATQARVFMAHHDDPARSGLALGFVDAIETEPQAFAALLDAIAAQKEKSMSVSPNTPAGRALSAAQAAARARHTHARAPRATAAPAAAEIDPDEDGPECEDCDGTGEVDGQPCEACDGTGHLAADKTSPEDDEMNAAAMARAISASAEAKAHPQLALAAIGSGQTLAQFQATVGALGAVTAAAPAARQGRVATLADTGYRIHSDGPPAAPAAALSSDDIYARRAAEAAKAGAR